MRARCASSWASADGLRASSRARFQLEPLPELLHGDARLHERHAICQPCLREFEVRFVLRLRVQVLALDLGGHGSLGESRILQLRLQIGEIGLSLFHLRFGFQILLIDLRAAELEQNRSGADGLSGLHVPPLHAPLVGGGDHDNDFRNEGSDSPHPAKHLAPFALCP